MAYPTVSAPYGFKPVNRLDGLPYAGATRKLPIEYNYSENIFYGDVVQISGGTVVRSSMSAASSPGTAVAGTIGIFLGCSYTSPTTGQKLFAQYYPASTAANDIEAIVVDDPRALMKVVVTTQGTSLANTSTTVGYLNPYYIGSNLYMVGGAGGVTGSTTTGNSAQSVSGAVVTSGTSGAGDRVTSALPWRMVGVVTDTAYTLSGVGSTSGGTRPSWRPGRSAFSGFFCGCLGLKPRTKKPRSPRRSWRGSIPTGYHRLPIARKAEA